MKYIALSITVYITMALQTSSQFAVLPMSVRMAGLVAIAVAVGSRMPTWRGIILAAAIGFLSDLLTPGRMGIEMALAVAMAFAIQFFRTESHPGVLQLAGTTFVGVFLIRLIAMTVDQMDGGHSTDPITIAAGTLMAAGFFAIVIPLIFSLWKLVARIVTGDSLPDSSTPTDRWLASSG